jgi:hypothetical protein
MNKTADISYDQNLMKWVIHMKVDGRTIKVSEQFTESDAQMVKENWLAPNGPGLITE